MNAKVFAEDALDLWKKAREMLKAAEGGIIPKYWLGVEKASAILLERHAWNQIDAATKKVINVKRFEADRAKARVKGSEARKRKAARTKHLGEDSWDSAEMLCGMYLGSKGAPLREHNEWRANDRIAEVTCRECLTKAVEKKMTGAFEQLQKIFRQEEGELKVSP